MTLRFSIFALALLAVASQTFAQDASEETWIPGNRNLVFTDPQDFWISGEYLMGWVEGQHLPALVTTSPVGTSDTAAGIFPAPAGSTTSVLFSGTVNDEMLSGFRFGSGYVVNREAGISVQAGMTYLPGQSTSFSASSTDFPILARPYLSVKAVPITNPNQAALIAFPTQSTGNLTIDAKTDSFFDAHVGIAERIFDEGGTKVDALFGYRYGHFSDSIRFSQRIVPTTAPSPTTIDSVDSFDARNNFHGVDFGVRSQTQWDNVSLSLLGKIAAGNMRREIEIAGTQVATVSPIGGPVDTQTSVGGLYALSTNIGNHSQNAMAIFPEFGATLAWQVSSNFKVRLGYTGLVLGRTARAANQIDYAINIDHLPGGPASPTGPQRPSVPFDSTNLVIQSLSFGADLTF